MNTLSDPLVDLLSVIPNLRSVISKLLSVIPNLLLTLSQTTNYRLFRICPNDNFKFDEMAGSSQNG